MMLNLNLTRAFVFLFIVVNILYGNTVRASGGSLEPGINILEKHQRDLLDKTQNVRVESILSDSIVNFMYLVSTLFMEIAKPFMYLGFIIPISMMILGKLALAVVILYIINSILPIHLIFLIMIYLIRDLLRKYSKQEVEK